MRHGEVKGRPLMCATNSHMHANERLFFFPPQDMSCRVLASGRQQRLNSGISWTQHWRFGLCLHKGEGRGCKLFTGECRVTALCACLYMRACWSVDVCLECNNVASAIGSSPLWLRRDQQKHSAMCPYAHIQRAHAVYRWGAGRWFPSAQQCTQKYLNSSECESWFYTNAAFFLFPFFLVTLTFTVCNPILYKVWINW